MRSQPPQIQSGGGPRGSGAALAAPALARYLDRFRSAEDLCALLRRAGHRVEMPHLLDLLAGLVEAGRLDSILGEDGRVMFRSCSRIPHHHLVCRECGRTVEVIGPDIEVWVAHNARHHRYCEVKATVEMYGVCPVCDLARRAGERSTETGALDHRNGRS